MNQRMQGRPGVTLPLLAVLAAGAVGAFLIGVPFTTIVLVGALLCCPLMMLFMDHGHDEGLTIRRVSELRRTDRVDRSDRAA